MFNFSKYAQNASEVSSTLGDAASKLQEGYKAEAIPGAPVENPTDLNTLQQGVDTEEQRNLLERMGGLESFNYFMEEMKLKYGPSVEAMKSQLLNMNSGNTLLNNFTEQGKIGLEHNVENLGDFSGTASMIPRTKEVDTAKREIERTIQQHAIAMKTRAEMLAAASFNLKHHKKHSQVMEQPMGQPMGAMPMEQPMEQPAEQIEGQSSRFPVQNEGDFISKFAEDLLAYNNQPGTQEYERARIAAEEIRDTVSPGFEEEANSILESVMQLDDIQRDQASNYLIKLYEVLIPPAFKSDQNGSQMEPVMSDNNQDAVEGIVRFSLTDSVLNNKSMTKTAADQFGQQYLLYGPTEKRICPKLRSKNLSVGDVVSEYTCRHHCLDGIVIDDNKTICGEALWRANAMDKYSREYVDADGNIEGGYLNKRFEINRNVPEENKMRLKPGETRKPRPAEWGNTESRLQAMRAKEGQNRDYRPTTNTGDPFEWCHDSDQNNVEVSQTERNRREEASGNQLVQYTNRDQGENNPKKAFNLKHHKTAQFSVDTKPMTAPFSGGNSLSNPGGGYNPALEQDPMAFMLHKMWKARTEQELQQIAAEANNTLNPEDLARFNNNLQQKQQDLQKGNQFDQNAWAGSNENSKTAQAPIVYKPMDKPNIAVNPSAAGVDKPSDIQNLKEKGVDTGKPMKKKKTESKEKKASGFNLNQHKKEASKEPSLTFSDNTIALTVESDQNVYIKGNLIVDGTITISEDSKKKT